MQYLLLIIHEITLIVSDEYKAVSVNIGAEPVVVTSQTDKFWFLLRWWKQKEKLKKRLNRKQEETEKQN